MVVVLYLCYWVVERREVCLCLVFWFVDVWMMNSLIFDSVLGCWCCLLVIWSLWCRSFDFFWVLCGFRLWGYYVFDSGREGWVIGIWWVGNVFGVYWGWFVGEFYIEWEKMVVLEFFFEGLSWIMLFDGLK